MSGYMTCTAAYYLGPHYKLPDLVETDLDVVVRREVWRAHAVHAVELDLKDVKAHITSVLRQDLDRLRLELAVTERLLGISPNPEPAT